MKKANFTAMLVVGIGTSILSANGACLAPPSGLVAWWPAEGNATDVAGANAGTLENGTVFSSGWVGQAFNFDGANDDVRIPASAALNVGAGTGFTMEFWMNPAKQTLAPLVEWNNGLGNWGVHLWQSTDVLVAGDGVGNLVAGIFDTLGNEHHIIAPSGLLTTNVYQHVALTYDKTSGVAVIYHNGSAVKTQNLGVFTPQTSYDLYLGRRASGAFSTDYFKGSLDEVSVYGRALGSNEIAAIYTAASAGKCAVSSPPVVVSGPVTNSANAHAYFLLSGSTWIEAEAKAVQLGGHLVTINDAIEDNWVYTTFSSYGGINSHLWIGLTDQAQEGTFVWISGEPATYTHWHPGEPNSFNGDEDYAHINSPVYTSLGTWNDHPNSATDSSGHPFRGVVEIGGAAPPPISVQAVSGPITNDANGHAYYLLSGSTWTDAEAKAITLGGHLATINDVTEGDWVFNTFGNFGGTNRELWIGLSDAAVEGTFVWSSGEPVSYTRWYPGEPNNYTNNEDYAFIWASQLDASGRWADAGNIAVDGQGRPICGVVEIGPTSPPPVAQIVAGPITNNASGHAYYLLGGSTWTEAEARAITLGGHLATINDLTESDWVFTTFGNFGSINRELWIGLNDAAQEGTFVWSSGEPVGYTRWYPGEPNNYTNNEDYAFIWASQLDASGRWADAGNIAVDGQGRPICGVVEISSALPPSSPLVPQIASFTPALGSNGTVVTLIGTNFSSVPVSNIVYFGAVRAAVTLASPTSLTVVVPTGATYAPPSVTVAGMTGQANTSFMPTFDGGGAGLDTAGFAARLDLPASSAQLWVGTGDLDGDGKPDVVIANSSANTVSVYRNISTSGALTAASFASLVTFSTGNNPYACAVGDVDGDGKLDIIAANNGNGSGNTVSVLRNTSTPGSISSSSFAPRVDFTVATGPTRLAVGDLDGDGRMDIAAATSEGAGISVLRNTGNAGSVDASSFASFVHFPTGPNAWDVRIADLDGDGKRDLVASSYDSGTVSLLRNQSSPGSLTTSSFAAKVDFTMGTIFDVAVADLDGDGKPELVASKYTGSTVAVYRNISTAGFLNSTSFATPVSFATSAGPSKLGIGDLDGDGRPDLAVCAYDANQLSLLRNTGTIGSITSASFAPKVDFASASSPSTVAVGDLDGDGRPDLVASSWGSSSISIFRNTVAPTPPYVPQPVPQITSFSPALGSNGTVVTLTGTSFSDVAASNIVYFGAVRAAVTLASPASLTVVVPSGATYAAPSVTVAGLSGQANKPFVPTFDNGGGTIDTTAFAPKFDLPAGSIQIAVAIGDLDGDGKPDVVAANASASSVSVYRNISASGNLTAGSFALRVDLPTGSYPYSCAVADVDGDGKLDIIVGNNGNGSGASVSVFRNISAAGSLATSSFAPGVDFATATGPTRIAVGDLDGDGRLDLAVVTSQGAGVSILRNTGVPGTVDAGSFAAFVHFPTGPNSWGVKIADLDGDGKPDLLAASYDSGTVSLLRNVSTPGNLTSGSFAPKVDIAVGTTFEVAVGDLDGDGKPDLAVTKYSSSAVAVLRNTSTVGSLTSSSFAAAVSFATAVNPGELAIGDLDGDGKPDLAVCASGANQISVLRNISTMGTLSTGSFAPKVDFGCGASPAMVAIGDLDGDGRPDLVASSFGSSAVSVLKNTVAPTPPTITQNPTNRTVVAGSPAAFSVGATGSAPLAYQWRLNGTNVSGATNASYNIVAAQESQAGFYSVHVTNQFGVADSSNALLTVLPPPAVPVIYSFAPGKAKVGEAVQLIGTNFSDVAVSNIVYFGAVRALVVAASPASLTVVVPSGATFAPPSVTVAGLSGQAKLPFLPTYLGTPVIDSSSFAPKVDFTATTRQATVASGDLDGDGKPDLMVANFDAATVSVYRNISSNGVLNATSFAPRISFSTGTSPYAWLGDVDGDGKLDILVANNGSGSGNTVSVLRNTSTPGILTNSSFAARVNFTTATGPLKIEAGDLDGDGKTDLAVCCGNSRVVSILRNIGTPGVINASTFAARVDVAATVADRDVKLADLDGDGKLDLIVANFTGGSVSVLRNIATRGSLATNSFAPRVNLVTGSLYNIAVGDLDGDGRLDIAVDNRPSSIGVFRNIGAPGSLSSNSFAAKVSLPVSGEPYMVAIGDIDGDGKPDLAASIMNSNAVAVLRNTASPGTINSNSFAARVMFATGTGPRNVVLGDLDADGRPDLAVANLSSSFVSVLKNTVPFPAPPVFTQQPVSQSVVLGDLVTFSANATGGLPLSYQWRFNGDNILGASNNSLTLPEAQLASVGSYSVVVSNGFGATNSSNAVLAVTVPNCTEAPAGLVAWWPGNGNAFDSVGTNHGTLLDGTGFGTGKVAQGFLFGSSADGVQVPANPALDIGAGAGFTIESWINPASLASAPIVEWNNGTNAFGLHFWIGNFGGDRGILVNLVDAGGGHHYLQVGGVMTSNTFQHVAATYDKASGIVRLFRNGAVIGESVLGTVEANTAWDIYIGRRPAGSNPAGFKGTIDETSIYNRALNTNEIAAVYAARGAGKCPLSPTVLSVTPPGWFVNEGQTVTFTAVAVGTPPLSYQWQFGSSPIGGATSPTLTLSNVVFAQSGNYSVIVSNLAGTTTSSNVLLRVNRAPLADAGATDLLLISPNGSNVVAVLDGSHSSDPDGDALTYGWFHTGDASPFDTGVVAVTTLPVGTNHLTLIVNDGMASGSQAFAVEVITTSQAVDRLMALVQSDVPKANALLASLRAALAAIDRSQPQTAINQLEAFKNKVLAQIAPTDPALANQLLADAQAIIDALNGGGAPGAVALEITSISQGDNGKPHLKIRGAAGRVHIVETSTDMVNWTMVGVAGCCGTCEYEFNDTQTPPVEARFYRVVSPK